MIQRCFLVSAGVLFMGTASAFFLFVPILSIMTVGSVLLGLMLMFGLGIQVGTTRVPASDRPPVRS